MIETYFRYEVEEVKGGVRSRVQPEHIQEEMLNMKEVDPSGFYSRVSSPVLILRATDGMLGADDLVLPEEAVRRMVREMPNAKRVDLEGENHYSILFRLNEKRDSAIRSFIEE